MKTRRSSKKILLLEDDILYKDLIRALFRIEKDLPFSFKLDWCSSIREFRELISTTKKQYNLIIIDQILPDGDGKEVVRWLRQDLKWICPIIMVSAHSSHDFIAEAMKAGIDDFIPKPTHPHIFMEKVKHFLVNPVDTSRPWMSQKKTGDANES